MRYAENLKEPELTDCISLELNRKVTSVVLQKGGAIYPTFPARDGDGTPPRPSINAAHSRAPRATQPQQHTETHN